MIFEDRKGNQLLALRRGDEAALAAAEPLTHALVVVRNGEGKHLLVYDRYKRHWELAGGGIEPSETARACARRELEEESGIRCDAEALRFVGVMTFLRAPDSRHAAARIEYGALYAFEVAEVAPFEANAEIAAVTWWDRLSPIGDIADIDAKLIELVWQASVVPE